MGGERSIEQRLDDVERLVRTLVVRVAELELDRGAPALEPTPTAGPGMQSAPAAAAASPPSAAPPPRAAPQAMDAPKRPAKPDVSLEDLLGGRILAWLGGLAILVGAILFLVIAVDRGWIGVEARIALAFAGSTVLLAVGLFVYERVASDLSRSLDQELRSRAQDLSALGRQRFELLVPVRPFHRPPVV